MIKTIIVFKPEYKDKEYIKCEKCGGKGVVEVGFEEFRDFVSSLFDYKENFKEAMEIVNKWREYKNGKWRYYIECDKCEGEGRF